MIEVGAKCTESALNSPLVKLSFKLLNPPRKELGLHDKIAVRLSKVSRIEVRDLPRPAASTRLTRERRNRILFKVKMRTSAFLSFRDIAKTLSELTLDHPNEGSSCLSRTAFRIS